MLVDLCHETSRFIKSGCVKKSKMQLLSILCIKKPSTIYFLISFLNKKYNVTIQTLLTKI